MCTPTNSMEALLPIFVLDWIFCFGVIHYEKLKIKNLYSFIYSIITVILYNFFLFYLTVVTEAMDIEYNIMTFIVSATNFMLMNINVVIGWIFKNKAVRLTANILKVDDTLNSFGIPINVKCEFRFAIIIAVFWILVIFLINLLIIIEFNRFYTILRVSLLIHPYFVNLLIDLRFFLMVRHMWLRFKNINKALKRKLKSNTKNLKLAKKSDRRAIPIQIDRELDPTEFIHKIRYVHIELEELCFEITKLYGIPIILTMIGKFILITGFMFQEVAILLNRPMMIPTKTPSTIIFLTWFLPSAFTFICINFVCQQTIQEWKQTREILARWELESKDAKLQEEIRNFSSQTQKNSLKFSPCGLFDLGSYFIRDFVAAVMTYLIITIQTFLISKN